MFGWLFKRATPEKRSSGAGYTAAIMAARESYISGGAGLGELTATAQACVSLWEGAFAIADVQGTDLLTRAHMALIARSVALRGEAVLRITGAGLVPVAEWDLSTRQGIPRAYRISVSEAGGGHSETVLAGEVIHLRIGSDMVAPWTGTGILTLMSMIEERTDALSRDLENQTLSRGRQGATEHCPANGVARHFVMNTSKVQLIIMVRIRSTELMRQHMKDVFSTSDVVTAANVLPGTFQNWTKRGDLFFPEGSLGGGKGQGNHRRYSVAALMHVVIGTELILIGLSPADAFRAAARFSYGASDRRPGLPYHWNTARATLLVVPTGKPQEAQTVAPADDGKLPIWLADTHDDAPAAFVVVNITRCFCRAFDRLRIDPQAYLDRAYGVQCPAAAV